MCQLQGEGQRDTEQAVQLQARVPTPCPHYEEGLPGQSGRWLQRHGCSTTPVFPLYSASSAFLSVLYLWPVRSTSCRGPSPVPRQSPSSQQSQGPAMLLFPIEEEKHFLLSLFLPLPPALPCLDRGDFQEGVGEP